jgi:NNP family nitrate/nitrite transporter-like MFS transporter
VRYPELRGKALLFLLVFWSLWYMNMCVRVIFSPILPLIEDEFGITHARASSLFMFQAIGYGFSMFFSGFFAGRLGYKRTIVTSLCVSSILFLLIPFVKVFSLLYLFNLILGISIGMYLPSAIPLITEHFSEKDWGKSIAIHDSGAAVSIFSIPLVAVFFLQFMEWRGIFTVFGVAFLLFAVIFQKACTEVKIGHSPRRAFGDLVRIPSLWLMATLFTFASGANLGIYSIVPLYLTKELSMDIGYSNTILGISRLGGIGVAILAGFLVDRINLKRVMFTIIFLTGALTVCLGLAPVAHVGVFLFLQAIFVTGFFPVGLVCIAKMFGREIRSMATGLILTVAIVFGVGIIPYFLGLSGDLVSFRFGITVLGALVGMSSFLAFSLKIDK